MKPKNVIVEILLLGIVVLLMSTSVQAKELTEVNATDILKQIENGEDIFLENVRITGEFNLSKIKLKTSPIARSEWEISFYDLEEELKIVESKIEIYDSVFEDDVDFSNTQFRKDIDFYMTSFLGGINFRVANFTGYANFRSADFAGDAYFQDADFAGDARFYRATFAGDAYFQDADFAGDARFYRATFAGDARFDHATFAGYASFYCATFAGPASFYCATFAGYATFHYANFAGFATFYRATFASDTHFDIANFARDATFYRANFAGDAYFDGAEFNKINFRETKFTYVRLNEIDFSRMDVEWCSLKDALVHDGQTYMKLIKNFRETEQFEDADAAYLQYQRFRRKVNEKGSYSLLFDKLAWVTCGHGVRPLYTIVCSVEVILLFTFIYWRGNGIRRLKEIEGDDVRVSFWGAFYFSVVTFTTVGYGDWYPEDRYRIVVMIEGVLGWLLLALFIVTLANVMIRA